MKDSGGRRDGDDGGGVIVPSSDGCGEDNVMLGLLSTISFMSVLDVDGVAVVVVDEHASPAAVDVTAIDSLS